jgi:hypothetical protein
MSKLLGVTFGLNLKVQDVMHFLWKKFKRNSSFEVLFTSQLLELVSLSTQYFVFPSNFSWQFGMGLSKQYGNVKQS